MFLPYDEQTKLAVAPALGAIIPHVVGAGASLLGAAASKPKKPKAQPEGPSLGKSAAAVTAGGSDMAATHPKGSTAKPNSSPANHAPTAADGAFQPVEYSQPDVPVTTSRPKMKKLAVQLDTALNAAAAFGPMLYDHAQGRKARRAAEDAEIAHLESQIQPKISMVPMNPKGAINDYIEGMGHAGLDALTEEQRVRNSSKHLPSQEVRRTQV